MSKRQKQADDMRPGSGEPILRCLYCNGYTMAENRVCRQCSDPIKRKGHRTEYDGYGRVIPRTVGCADCGGELDDDGLCPGCTGVGWMPYERTETL